MASCKTHQTPFHRGSEWLPIPINPDSWSTHPPIFCDLIAQGLTRLLSDAEQHQFQQAFIQRHLNQDYDYVSDRLRYRLIRQLIINQPLRDSCLALQDADHWWSQVLTHVSMYSAWPFLPDTLRTHLITCIAHHTGGRPLLLLHDPTLQFDAKDLPEHMLAGVGLKHLPAQRRCEWFHAHLRGNLSISYASLIVLAQIPAEQINDIRSTSPAILINPWLHPPVQKPLLQKLTRSADPESYWANVTGRFPIFTTLDLRRSSLNWCTSSEALTLWSLFASLPLDQVLHCHVPTEQDFDRAVLDQQLKILSPRHDYVTIRRWIKHASVTT